jgi:hypothetical protein
MEMLQIELIFGWMVGRLLKLSTKPQVNACRMIRFMVGDVEDYEKRRSMLNLRSLSGKSVFVLRSILLLQAIVVKL